MNHKESCKKVKWAEYNIRMYIFFRLVLSQISVVNQHCQALTLGLHVLETTWSFKIGLIRVFICRRTVALKKNTTLLQERQGKL